MNKKLYYVIEKELRSIDDVEETTGNKTIRVYEIENDMPKIFCTLDVDITDNSREVIQDYLDDNGYGDETFDLIHL
jgi:hypothetical protein